jgi:hypothetical protein
MNEDDEDDDEKRELFSPSDIAALNRRIREIQESGSTPMTPRDQQLVQAIVAKPTELVLQEFFFQSSPEIVQAMVSTIGQIMGSLSVLEFESKTRITCESLASLAFQLQMTGYMLRNAEYVMTIRKILRLKGRSTEEFHDAFFRIDSDGSGYIETKEVERVLADVYGEEAVPKVEIAAFINLFDSDSDGRISWDEFKAGLGAVNSRPSSLPSLAAGTAPVPMSGKVKLTFDSGKEVEMDANEYMDQLKAEAGSLRRALAKIDEREALEPLSDSITAYVSSLDSDQLELLTSGITEDVVKAMKEIVKHILPDLPAGIDHREASMDIDRQKLHQLCLFELITGYQLREMEAREAMT